MRSISETKKGKVKAGLKKALLFVFNPRLLLCLGLAWFITNGWSYVMTFLGTWLDIDWMKAVGGGYLVFLWLPVSPEKIVTVTIAIALLRWLFPHDQKTLAVLHDMRLKLNMKRKLKLKRRTDNMPIKAVLFDLDGTLLPMDQDVFLKTYFERMAQHMVPYGYDPQELIKAIWTGTVAMVKNQGPDTNEAVFWEACKKIYGQKVLDDIPNFDAFYGEKFNAISEVCGQNPQAAQMVRELKKKGYRVILATNPVFPPVATQIRIRWAGLQIEDFEYYTTYANATSCKPSLAYYQEILEKTGLQAEECLMVGNDVGDDMVVTELGMQVFLLTDCLIHKNDADISRYPNGSFPELAKYIDRQQRK